jgi:hypothetical protein
MKALIIDVVNRTYWFLNRLFDEQTGGEILIHLATQDPLPQWENPTLPSELQA